MVDICIITIYNWSIHIRINMYLCICNAITESDLAENSFLLSLIGSKCGKCIEEQSIQDGERVTYLKNNEKQE